MNLVTTRFRLSVTAAIMLVAVSGCTTNSQPSDASSQYAAAAVRVTALMSPVERIRADVEYLADDAREGREAGTPGYDAAADYVAARMAAIGIAPGHNGEWFQPVTLRTSASVPEKSHMTIAYADGGADELTFLEDFKISPSVQENELDLTAPAVFVGYGVQAPDAGHDDLEGLDLEGKIVLRFGGAPDGFDSEKRAHYGNGGNKAKIFAERGAVGVIGLYTDNTEKRFPWERMMRNPVSRSTTWVHPDGKADVSGPGIKAYVSVNPEVSQKLFEGAAKSYMALREEEAEEGAAPEGFALPVTITLKGASEFTDMASANVVGVIEGGDPFLKKEVLVITAHLDHVGVDEHDRGEKEDIINNGAMDNAMGVSMLLETARRFKEGPTPARTIVFLAVTAEEKGLLGADYFAHYPSLANKEMVANVNLDMPVMLHEFTDIVAFGAERSSLGEIVERALGDAGVTLSPDPLPEQGIFTRSDHYRFVEQGVPSIFLWPGFANGGEAAIGEFLAKHYHKPSDEISLPIFWDDAARFADVNYKIAREIADSEARPTWNEGDFFGDLFAGE